MISSEFSEVETMERTSSSLGTFLLTFVFFVHVLFSYIAISGLLSVRSLSHPAHSIIRL